MVDVGIVDPFTLVYKALWEMLEDHDEFKSFVREGNRVKFTGKPREYLKTQVQDADLPEVRLVPAGAQPHLQRTSNGSSVVERFEIQIATGSEGVDLSLYPVKWAVFKAMSNWSTRLSVLTWNENKFVKLARPTAINDGSSGFDEARGIKGWTSVWACEVELWFRTADLQGA